MEHKKQYIEPQIELVRLDNDISLALESTPPEGPLEYGYNTPEFFNNNPIQNV